MGGGGRNSGASSSHGGKKASAPSEHRAPVKKAITKKKADHSRGILDFRCHTAPMASSSKAKTGEDSGASQKGYNINCRHCKAKSKEVAWGQYMEKRGAGTVARVPFGDACEKCWKAYVHGDFEAQGSWEQVVDDAAENEEKGAELQSAIDVQSGQAQKTWLPQEMKVSRKQTLVAKCLYRGLRPGEFQKRFGVEASSLGYKVQDLIHPDQSVYKGILVRDDGTLNGLGVLYELGTEIAVIIEETKVAYGHKGHW